MRLWRIIRPITPRIKKMIAPIPVSIRNHADSVVSSAKYALKSDIRNTVEIALFSNEAVPDQSFEVLVAVFWELFIGFLSVELS